MENVNLQLSIFICILNQVNTQTMTIDVVDSFLEGQDELNITCYPPRTGLETIGTIQLWKSNSSSNDTTTEKMIVFVTYDRATSSSIVYWQDKIMENRDGVTATGSIDTVASSFLRLKISPDNTRCSDGTIYRCTISGSISGGPVAVTPAEKEVQANALPSFVRLTATSPISTIDEEYVYNINTKVNFTCTGTVGNPPELLRLCYKHENDTKFLPFENTCSFCKYAIDQDAAFPSDNCQYTRTSTLQYFIDENDSHTEILCEIQTSDVCRKGMFSSSLTFRSQSLNQGVTGENHQEAKTQSCKDIQYKTDTTVIAGVVTAWVVTLALSIIVTYIVTTKINGNKTKMCNPCQVKEKETQRAEVYRERKSAHENAVYSPHEAAPENAEKRCAYDSINQEEKEAPNEYEGVAYRTDKNLH